MKKNYRLVLYGIIFLTIITTVILQKSKPFEYKVTLTEYLDTVCEITAYTNKKSILYDDCVNYIKNMDNELSATNAESSLYKSNNGEDVIFSHDANVLITFGKNFSEENPTYFSIYLEPLISAWDIKNNSGTIPDLTAALKESQLQKSINLGAVAKGFITDRLVTILKDGNVTSAMINLGGNAYAIGKKPTGEAWKIGIQDPRDENELIGVISAENLAVISSGDYQRYFEKDGVRYHHILNPVTGYPSDSGLRSVTVIDENATLADALSTAIFVAGLDEGKKLLQKYGAQGIFVTDDTVYFSKSLENIFRQNTFSYKYEFIY